MRRRFTYDSTEALPCIVRSSRTTIIIRKVALQTVRADVPVQAEALRRIPIEDLPRGVVGCTARGFRRRRETCFTDRFCHDPVSFIQAGDTFSN